MSEEGIRAELNTWAAWLETAGHNPNHSWLMGHMIQTRQIFTLEPAVRTEAGHVGLEEDVVVTERGCEFLSFPRQPILV